MQCIITEKQSNQLTYFNVTNKEKNPQLKDSQSKRKPQVETCRTQPKTSIRHQFTDERFRPWSSMNPRPDSQPWKRSHSHKYSDLVNNQACNLAILPCFLCRLSHYIHGIFRTPDRDFRCFHPREIILFYLTYPYQPLGKIRKTNRHTSAPGWTHVDPWCLCNVKITSTS